jgi:hypothetical protein
LGRCLSASGAGWRCRSASDAGWRFLSSFCTRPIIGAGSEWPASGAAFATGSLHKSLSQAGTDVWRAPWPLSCCGGSAKKNAAIPAANKTTLALSLLHNMRMRLRRSFGELCRGFGSDGSTDRSIAGNFPATDEKASGSRR